MVQVPPDPSSLRHPSVPAFWTRSPLPTLRSNTAMALLTDDPTYTDFPSGLTATAPAPSSARPTVQPVVAAFATHAWKTRPPYGTVAVSRLNEWRVSLVLEAT